jgi:antitoxin ParD1/3/4
MSSTTKVAKVSVTLTTEMTDLIQQAGASGDYASASGVISEALREWKHRRATNGAGQDLLRRL